MFGSATIEVAIGLVFIYFILSLICTAIKEVLESWLKTRAVDLERGIRELLNDPGGAGLTSQLFGHPMIYGLFKGDYKPPGKDKAYKRGSDLPSYIPPRSFAIALMNIIMPVPAAGEAGIEPISLKGFSDSLENLPDGKTKDALRIMIRSAGGDIKKVREGIEAWYNATMSRVSGWYKRRTQKAVLLIAVLLAVSMNADTINIARSLAANATFRSAVAGSASTYFVKMSSQDAGAQKEPGQELMNDLALMKSLSLPIGWNTDAATKVPLNFLDWVCKLVGLFLTAAAISLGAPFWFDLLNKIVNLRASLVPKPSNPPGPTAQPVAGQP
jgi:hypothetical protein